MLYIIYAVLWIMLPTFYTLTTYCGNATIHQLVSLDTKTGKMHLDTNANFIPAPFDWEGTLKLCGKAAGATYICLLAYLTYKGYFLFHSNSWALWRSDVSLQSLYQLPQKTVADELLIAVKAQYTQAYNTIDAIARFTQSVNEEIYRIEKFRTLRMAIDMLNLSILFPQQKNILCQAQDRIDRLNYLKQVIYFASIDTQPLTKPVAAAA